MTARDDLAELIASVTIDTTSGDVLRVHPDGETPVFEGDQRTADAILAAGYSKPRIVATYDELHALRAGVAVIDTGGVVMQLQVPDERGPYGYWAIVGVQGDFPYSSVTLPATVLHGGGQS